MSLPLSTSAAPGARSADRRTSSGETDAAATHVSTSEHGRIPLAQVIVSAGCVPMCVEEVGKTYRSMSGTMKKRTWLPRI